MAKLSRKKGTTSQIFHVFIQDSSSTTGAGLTGLAYTGAGITPTVKYINAGGTLSASITLEDITTLGTYAAPTSNAHMRFKEVNSASPSQGVYEIHVHNDWMNLTGGSLVIMMAGATNMAQFRMEVDLAANSADLVDDVWDESLTAATHNVANSAGKRLRLLGATAVMSGTLPSQAGAAINAIILDAGASATSHIYTEALLVIDTGTAVGEGHHILSYNGTTKVAILDDDWVTQPVAGDTYQIYASSAFDAVTGLAQAGGANTITLQSDASATNDLYINQSIYIPSGTGAGQRKRISGYNGTTKVATVSSNWAITPNSTSAYMIYEGNQVYVDVNNDKTGYSISGTKTTLDALNDISAANILTTALTESYAADGATATLSQLLYMIYSGLVEFSISGTTITCKKLDGSTTAMTFTLNDGTNPTSRTRAT